MRRILIFKLIFTFAAATILLPVPGLIHTARASEASSADIRVPAFWEIVTDLPKDLKAFGLEVVKPENRGVLVGVTAMTAITVATDYESWQALRYTILDTTVERKIANMGTSIGDGFFQFGIVGGFVAAGVGLGDRRALRTASQITESIFATGIVVQIIKHITGRESPFSSETRTGVWRLFPDQLEYHKDFQKFDAVPSGHLSTAVTTFIVIQENYPEQKWIPWVGWPVMGWVAYGLVSTGIHWWSDFPIAIALGYSFGRIITRENRGEETIPRGQSLFRPLLMPTFSSRGEPMVAAGWVF
jgi:membrane-associated phospholipid phosphatase